MRPTHLSAAALLVVLAGCGATATDAVLPDGPPALVVSPAGTAGPSAGTRGAGPAERDRLLRHADALAAEHEGTAPSVLGVLTTTKRARSVTGWAEGTPDEQVWVLDISGDDYFCTHCSGPSDEGKRSTHLTLTVRADDLDETVVYGFSSQPYDLASMGAVERLR